MTEDSNVAVKKRGLGRGLDALLGSVDPDAAHGEAGDSLRELPVEAIQPGKYQPRTVIDPEALEALAQSIRTQGVVQPIVVRPAAEGRYELIAGERRWRASRLAGLSVIPALVRDVPDRVAMAVALIENIQRENLNPLEEAAALGRLIDECQMTHQQCAEAVGRSRASVSNLLRLMELNADVQELVNRGELDMGHARALLALEGERQSEAARRVVERGLNVRQTEALVKSAERAPVQRPKRPEADAAVQARESALAERLGARVRIRRNSGGSGTVVIRYNNLGDLDKLLARIQ